MHGRQKRRKACSVANVVITAAALITVSWLAVLHWGLQPTAPAGQQQEAPRVGAAEDGSGDVAAGAEDAQLEPSPTPAPPPPAPPPAAPPASRPARDTAAEKKLTWSIWFSAEVPLLRKRSSWHVAVRESVARKPARSRRP
mmetsp:Transcript_37830/g.106962  ORF Transcript_37830/g.106962 Transcript_37830/m.106962 type:complete len:141 (-) Transcript_37830:367-789(-)